MWIALRRNWPEYLMEAWGLGTFMISAGVFGTLLEYPGSPVRQVIGDSFLRTVLMGLAMGMTAIGIIYSPWGRQSGAHINPAVTLTFWWLKKTKGPDAVFYMLAQCVGGTLGVLIVWAFLGSAFAHRPVAFVATVPGQGGPWAALAAEVLMAGGMMAMVLTMTAKPKGERFTGLAAGALVALYITFGSPISGFSINPARTLASALPSGIWQDGWIYFLAPPLAMLAVAYVHVRLHAAGGCAKFHHCPMKRCIFCGYEPQAGEAVRNSAAGAESTVTCGS